MSRRAFMPVFVLVLPLVVVVSASALPGKAIPDQMSMRTARPGAPK